MTHVKESPLLQAFSPEKSASGELRRISGPPLPPGGTPTSTRGLERLNERLEALAFRPADLGGQDSPPLETYTVTPGTYGDVVRATDEYVRWFRRTYPAAARADLARVPAPGPAPKGDGGKGFGSGPLTF